MVRELAPLLPVLVLLGCCRSEEASSTASQAERAAEALAAESHPEFQCPGKIGEFAPEKGFPSYPSGWPPDFRLPLEIHVDAPEPPPEIVGPSPPIQEPNKPAEKKADKKNVDEKKADESKRHP